MDWFRSISLFYQWKCYENEDVAKFVRFEKITPKQYKEITREEYPTNAE
ncbi:MULTISPECIES: XkdX family protein [Bacillus]|nr:XkdX family protein [Bacillus safensis]